MAAPWVAAAAGLSAITVNPDILWLCILHTTHPLLPSALRTSQHGIVQKGFPQTLTQREEMVMEKRDRIRISSRTRSPIVFPLQMSHIELEVASIDIAESKIARGRRGYVERM